MRWADTDSEDSDDEFQTHPSRSGSAMGNLIVNPQVRKKERERAFFVAMWLLHFLCDAFYLLFLFGCITKLCFLFIYTYRLTQPNNQTMRMIKPLSPPVVAAAVPKKRTIKN